MSIIVGLNCAHDASVCICVDGKILIAISEDRLTRLKHGSGFPARALKAAISQLGSDIPLHSAILVINQHPPADYTHEIRRFLPGLAPELIFINPSHHLLHALYAISTSGFDNAAVLVLDGSGYSYGEYLRRKSPLIEPGADYEEEHEAWTLFRYQRPELSVDSRGWALWVDDKNDRCRFPSIGHMYSLASQILFGGWTSAGKVMGLAAYGEADALDLEIIQLEDDGICVNVNWIYELPSAEFKNRNLADSVFARNLAAKVQSELEKGVLHLCRLARQRTGQRNLCLTGGVALNTVCNTLIRKNVLFEKIFVTPAAQDSGVAIGAAAYGLYISQGRIPNFSDQIEFLGTEFTGSEILDVLEHQKGIEYQICDNPVRECVSDLLTGCVVGWFEGRAEFGPRALGHRSILADPRVAGMKDRINAAVKFRESFRPFAGSILEERVNEYFKTSKQDPFMLFIADAQPHTRAIAPAVIHVDGTCRLQTVSCSYEGCLRQLLELFYEETGFPILLNTSLNLAGEPLCERPEDAVRTLLQSGMDVLYIQGFKVKKRKRSAVPLSDQVPALFETARTVRTASFNQKSEALTVSDILLEVGSGYTTRRHQISPEEDYVLDMVNGYRTAAEIVAALEGICPRASVERALLRLNDAGAIYFR